MFTMGLKTDDNTLLKAIQFLDQESDIFRAKSGIVPPVQNPSLELINKSIKENAIDLSATRGLSYQTQDALRLLVNNEKALTLISANVEERNLFDPIVEQTILNQSSQFGANLRTIAMTDFPPNDLKQSDIMLSLDNQQAKVKEILSFINFKNPELKQQVEANFDLSNIVNIRNQIANVNATQELIRDANVRMRM